MSDKINKLSFKQEMIIVYAFAISMLIAFVVLVILS